MADDTAEVATKEKTSCSFFKKSKNRRNVRKRQAESSDSDEGESTVVVRKEKKLNSTNPMIQKTEGLKDAAKENIRVEFESTRSAMSSGPTDLGATATYELDTEFDRDAQAVYAKALEVNKEIQESEGDDKVYRGINNYMQFYEKKDTALGNAASGMVR